MIIGLEYFCHRIVSFLEDIGWLKQEPNGEYIITNRGINNGQWKPKITQVSSMDP
jgi:hypothetical protein